MLAQTSINQNTPVNHWIGVNTVLGIRSRTVILEGEKERSKIQSVWRLELSMGQWQDYT